MGDFRARAGALTLLFLVSAQDRDDLLRILADAMVEEKDRVFQLDAEPGLESDSGEHYELEGEEEDFDDEDDEEYDDEEQEDLGDFDPHQKYVLAGTGAGAGGGDPSFELDPDQPIEATPTGIEALYVAAALEDWLAHRPSGPLELGEVEAGFALGALVFGWGTGVVHALAGEPLSLPELNAALPLPYRVIEEHLDSMERIALVEAVGGGEGPKRYAATDWLREGIVPIVLGARFEGHSPADDVAPPEAIDVEAAFNLALPLLELPAGISGSCRLAVGIEEGGEAGATVRLEDGRIVSRTNELEQQTDAWAAAPVIDWLDTLVEPTVARVEMGGDEHLAASLLAGLHERLFALLVM